MTNFHIIYSVQCYIFAFTMSTPAQRHMCYVHMVYLYYIYIAKINMVYLFYTHFVVRVFGVVNGHY